LEFFANLLECSVAGCKDAGAIVVKGPEEVPGFVILLLVEVFVDFVSKFFHASFVVTVQFASDFMSEGA